MTDKISESPLFVGYESAIITFVKPFRRNPNDNYVTDLGLRRALVGDLRGEDIDQQLENVVYREFVRCGWKVTVGRVREKEVDFVCQKPGKRRYVQVCYLMPTGETREREFSALESVPDQYEKIVLSMDRYDFSRNGVRHAYLPDYLTGLAAEQGA